MTKKFSKKIVIEIILIIALSLVSYKHIYPSAKDYIIRQQIEKENTKTINSIQKTDIIQKDTPLLTRITEDKITPPEKAYLEVEFICQAPFQTQENWKIHEESCEEAALLQAYLYEIGQTMTKEEADKEIIKMETWQKENLGNHHDLYAEEFKKFIMGYYNLEDSQITIIKKATIEDIQKQIILGHPVIVPVTSKILNNPFYPYPGYHMLIVTGYTKEKIITNDNGTKRGKDFSYDIETFKKAMDDTGGDIIILNLQKTL